MSFLTFAEFFEIAIRILLEYVKQNKIRAKTSPKKAGEKIAPKNAGPKLESK